jgi:hypothetical protein
MVPRGLQFVHGPRKHFVRSGVPKLAPGFDLK